MPPSNPVARPLFHLCLSVVAISGLASAGQPPSSPEGEPALRPTNSPRRGQPASVPGLEGADARLRPATLLREGSFLVRRRGSMVRLPSGEWAFVFHKDAQGRAERPMVLIPSQTLQRMEQTVGDRPGETVHLVTGEVFSYKGLNYLLPTAAVVESSRPADGPTPARPPAPSEAPAAAPPPASPEVQDLIKHLEAQRERPRTIDRSPDPGASVPGAPPPGPGAIAEGKTLVRRKGRVTRMASGDWAIVFDAGVDGDSAADRPMVLVPSLNLQRLEAIASRDGDAQSVEISGRILTYQNRNYLIPTLFQTTPDAEIAPRP